jgi:exoribonuclease R
MTSQIYKIIINNRNYDSGSWCVLPSNLVERFALIPLDAKLFSGDSFSYDSINGLTIVESNIRMKQEIPAVLIIAGNKTYGRHPTNNKLLYKCMPDDVSLPPFLVPYEIKNMGFSKVFVNLFVTIKFASWDNKHPLGTLTQVIGPVDACESFYEYQLYCKNLNTSLTKLNKACNKSLQENKETFVSNVTDKGIIEDRTDWQVFTIDPQGSLDFDDAFSIKTLDNGNTLISIYIANVVVCLERLNLWFELTKRTSTIYLPDKKRSMLPVILSDCLCSLQANAPRYAFTLDLEIDAFGTIVEKRFINCIIKVFKNFAYEERSLLRHPLYKCLLKSVTNLVTKYPYIKLINDSHDVVCYLMILMNHLSAKEMLGYNVGIFRSAVINEVESNLYTPDHVNQFIKIWRGSNCKYIDITSNNSFRHDILELDAYIHITSPIRRLVDILNMIKFQECTNLYKLSDAALDFYNAWSKDIDFINTTMKMTRRVQNDCNLLGLCNNNPDILEKIFDGYCFDETITDNGFYKYNVYLPDLKITLNIVSDKSLSYEKRQFKLFVFNNEEKMKKKIRLHLL